jgi:diphosphomevalonate decarboxylase
VRTSTAAAYANLAFVKYWGKRDPQLNIPLNGSISMNLSAARTETTVQFDPHLEADSVVVGTDNQPAPPGFARRVSAHLDRLRALADVALPARVATHNSFPTGAGFASSASGMAALTTAAAAALDLALNEAQLSALARAASGSACRSIPAGFVEWQAGTGHDDSFAFQIAPPEHWEIVDIAVVVSTREKDVPSSEGHLLALNSPFWRARLESVPARLAAVRRAILERDFETFGQELEAEAVSMHAVALTSPYTADNAWRSGIYYLLPDTLELMLAVQAWRADGVPVYFTLDAGPTVHLITLQRYQAAIAAAVLDLQARQPGRQWVQYISQPAPGAHLL